MKTTNNTDAPAADLAPTEASPLLIPDRASGYSRRADEPNAEEPVGDESERLGNPEMAKKMHLIFPAVGIGVLNPLTPRFCRQIQIRRGIS
jgi:hypothetical protein